MGSHLASAKRCVLHLQRQGLPSGIERRPDDTVGNRAAHWRDGQEIEFAAGGWRLAAGGWRLAAGERSNKRNGRKESKLFSSSRFVDSWIRGLVIRDE